LGASEDGMHDLIQIFASVLPNASRVVGFRGTETLSRPYEIEIFLVIRQEPGEEFDLPDAIGARASLAIGREDDRSPPHLFAGVFSDVEILHAYEGNILLRATLVPRLWHLGLSRHSRIFTRMKVPDVITSVLDENGVTDYELRLGSYDVEEHICQYQESDLDFISRWMEREGIFYFFEHSEDGETLVLCDRLTYDEDPLGVPVRYFPQLGQDVSAGASFRAFTCRHKTVRLKDYDYAKPRLNVAGSARVAANGMGEVNIYGDRFFTPAAGDKLARIRAEELLAGQAVYHATGARSHLRPGYVFQLEDHALASFNTRYLTVRAHHSGNQAAGLAHFQELTGIATKELYQVELDAITAKTQVRAESRTPWPRIYGYENGVVDGAADSEYAQIDEHGRYSAKFTFDESLLKNGNATTWVRMMQPHGGDIEGFHFPLRKGTEVVFSFLGGDPDRPVISGVVPNALMPSPVTSANHTKNVIQTGGRNRLEFEDKAGQQRITLSTPYSNTYLRMGSPNAGSEAILSTDDNILLNAKKAHNLVVGLAATDSGGELVTPGSSDLGVHVKRHLVTTLDTGNSSTSIPVGGWYLGTAAGVGVNAAGGVSFVVNKGHAVPTAPLTGGFYVSTVKGPIDVIAKTAHVKIDAVAADVTVHSGTTMDLRSVGTMTLTADAGSDVNITGDEVNVTTRKNYIHDIGGAWMKSVKGLVDIKVDGAKSEAVTGFALNLFGGIKLEVALSASASFTAGAKADITIGPKAEISVGPRFEGTLGHTSLGWTTKAEAAALMQTLTGLKQVTNGLYAAETGFGDRQIGLDLAKAGLKNTTAGLHMME
jgi:type VI secretion system secreted protein VgrG